MMPTFEHVPHCEEIVRWMSPVTGEDFRILKLEPGASLVQDTLNLHLPDDGDLVVSVEITAQEDEDDEVIYVMQEAQYPHFLQTVPEPVVKALLRNIEFVDAIRKAESNDAKSIAVQKVRGPATFSTVVKRSS